MLAKLSHELPLQNLLFVDLDEDGRVLFDRVHRIEAGCKVLHFLYHHANTRMSAEDIAFFAKVSLPVTQRSLQGLIELGMATRARIANMEFFGLTTEPKQRDRVRALFEWQELWHANLTQISQFVDGVSSARE
ncbi:MAG: hypothetical protein M1482_03530 [Chloroflexi bacterium]|nr:hypothetical protein [Chloroflexota bacterium]